MIMVKTDKSSIFETAYFLLRTDIYEPRPNENDMIKEANRIISENYSHKKRKRDERKRKLRNGIPYFIFGILSGIISTAIIWLFFFLG